MPPPPAIVWGFMFEFLYDSRENGDSFQLSRTSRAARAAVRETARLRAAWAHQQMVLLLGLYRGGQDVIVFAWRRNAARLQSVGTLHVAIDS